MVYLTQEELETQNDIELSHEEDDSYSEQECPKCFGSGCHYCLMLEW